MADLAMVFHWRPVDVENMTLADLMEWRERARIRAQYQGV